ncbi:MAG: helix-turn-helix domain-containing protein, partial [Nanoarchaeota archaeon]|nr:helix-turn-helix domain-containing protein [Nanoarchaeota archaeon]
MKNDKYIMIGMDDERSEHVAEVMKNKTCKKIIDYLADYGDSSENDISKGLSVPINTIEYNLQKLIKAGLVEKAKKHFWSVKGRKIDIYKLA